MLYVQLDTNWPDHPKLIRAGLDGMGLHALVMCLAKRLETDGWVDRLLLERRYAVPRELLDRLADLHLLDVNGDHVRPWGWLDRNPSQAAIAAKRATKAEVGKRGNHKRWHEGEFEDCPKCQTEEPQVIAGCDPTESLSESHPIATVSPESKPKPQPSDAIVDATPEPEPAHTPEQRRQRIMQAARLVAEERASLRDDVGPGWVAATAAGIASDHHQALHAHLAKNPIATALELVEEVIEARPTVVEVPTAVLPPPVADVLADQPPENFDGCREAVKHLRLLRSNPAADASQVVSSAASVIPAKETL